LPVNISHCDAKSASELTATVHSDADRPIKRVYIIADFYQNFRSLHGTATAVVSGELDPNNERDLTFTFDTPLPVAASGRASRCVASRLDYLDGTSQAIPMERH
jgi:hypothetical protein